jgi:hypothetical protein
MSEELTWTEEAITDGVQVVRCHSWLSFVDFIYNKFRASHGVVWRGHADPTWRLHPSLVRELAQDHEAEGLNIDDPELLGSLIKDDIGRSFISFRRQLKTFHDYADKKLKDLDVWALGQHHGQQTTLLDWTASPYVAAFFAFSGLRPSTISKDSFIQLYGLSVDNLAKNKIGLNSNQKDTKSTFRIVTSPYATNRRMIAQQGSLTYVWPPIELEALVRQRFVGEEEVALLRKVLIPQSEWSDFVISLTFMNINYRTLYPDLLGASLHANMASMTPSYSGDGRWIDPPGFLTNGVSNEP